VRRLLGAIVAGLVTTVPLSRKKVSVVETVSPVVLASRK
jgi:hypothetical protein